MIARHAIISTMKQGGFFKKTLRDVPLDGQTVLVRVDYNVPLAKDGTIKDDYRIRSSLPTIEALLARNCKVVLVSHLGRPDGKPNKSMSLEPTATQLSKLLKKRVRFIDDCIGDKVVVAAKKASLGDVLLLENLRFYPEEEANDNEFAAKLIAHSGATYFVQDGFGVVHRAHASTSTITQYAPSVAGLLVEKEYLTITGAMESPERPMVAVLGGAKISDKIKVVERFVELADKVIIGGAMSNNFLKYHGFPVGKSVIEKDVDPTIKSIYAAAAKKVGKDEVDKFLIIPQDVAVGDEISQDARRIVVDRKDVKSNEFILDLGTSTIHSIDRELEGAKTIVWNGPLGYTEASQFAHGSARLALFLASHPEVMSVIGGGDTADFVLHWDVKKGGSFTHVSTGGGASLELMAGDPMPGIQSLMDA